MFEVPAAKRVKRSQLFEDDTSDLNESISAAKLGESSNNESQPDVVPSYGFEYDFVDQPPLLTASLNKKQVPDEPNQPQEEAETFQFNLFRPNTTRKPPSPQPKDKDTAEPPSNPQPVLVPALISLRSASPVSATDPSLAYRQHRPDSYYFTVTASTPPDALKSLRASYADSAISADTINKHLARAWPGTYLPWRVVELPAHKRQVVVHRIGLTASSASAGSGDVPARSLGEQASTGRRARPSKKRREVRKGKARARQRIIDESKTKEEHEKEKRNRKNRERKLKRRAKERRDREEGRAGTGTGEGEGAGSKDVAGSEGSSGDD